jgi:integrase/recombinase XerD
LAGHGADTAGPVFRPVANNRTDEINRSLDPDSVYHNIVRKYGRETGIAAQVKGFLRSFAARDGCLECS